MIEVKLSEALAAHAALKKIGSVKLPAKTAWRVGRLIDKLGALERKWQEMQMRLLREHGGTEEGAGVSMRPPVREKDETEEAFSARQADFAKQIKALQEAANEALDEVEKIDYDPVPLSLFRDAEVEPNDMAALGTFVVDNEKAE